MAGRSSKAGGLWVSMAVQAVAASLARQAFMNFDVEADLLCWLGQVVAINDHTMPSMACLPLIVDHSRGSTAHVATPAKYGMFAA